jgi:FkbM family methyltransferase
VIPERLHGAPFDLVLDVGGNIGEFAEAAARAWPDARVVSFEPIPGAAEASRKRSRDRWEVITIGISEYPDTLTLWFCTNQHTASTMQAPGTARKLHFDTDDVHEPIQVEVQRLDFYLHLLEGHKRVLLKVDVEGHEAHVLRGGRRLMDSVTTAIVEVQQDGSIFLGSPSPWMVDRELRRSGLEFAGLADVFCAPSGQVLQFDGIWTRDVEPWRRH